MSFLNDVLNIFIKYYPQLLTGVGNTLLIALTSTAAGLALGLLTGVVRTAPMSKNPVLRVLHKLLNAIIAIYVEIFRGTPMMVQSMVIYWGYAFATGGDTLPLIPSGILIVSINTGAYMAEIVRGGIISIDRGQFEGAMSIGMTHAQTMFKVIIPQVMRNILPSVSNEFVINIKDILLSVSCISSSRSPSRACCAGLSGSWTATKTTRFSARRRTSTPRSTSRRRAEPWQTM